MHLYPIDGAVRRVGERRDRLGHPRRHLVDGDRRHRPDPAQADAVRRWAQAYWAADAPLLNLRGPTSTS